MSTQLCESSRQAAFANVIARWRLGELPSAQEALSKHPELGEDKSMVLDLALEEFSLRRQSGETIRPSIFCDQFPGYRRSLRKLIRTRCFLDGQPEYEAFMAQAQHAEDEEKEKERPWPEPNEHFLKFELLEVLGKGRYARVYLARQSELGGRLVAVKVADRPDGEAEAMYLGRLCHPNIVPVHSVETDPATGLTAVCMPYLGEATLYDLLDAAFVRRETPASAASAAIIQEVARSGKTPVRKTPPGKTPPGKTPAKKAPAKALGSYPEVVAQIILPLAQALAYTHAQGILHRDLKPSNVLLTPGAVPMLLDFNLSVNVQDLKARVGGTFEYMPPELLRSFANDAPVVNSPRTDLFSLGVIFYELLTGVVPFGEPEPGVTNRQAILELLSRQAEKISPASRRNSRVDPALDRIISRCIACDPQQRYASADELALDLLRYLSPGARRVRWVRRHRRALLLGGALTVFLAAGGGATLAWRGVNDTPLAQGKAAYQRGDFAQARHYFSLHLKDHPTDGEALLALGKTDWNLGELAAAERDFLQATKYSRSGESHAWMGYCLSRGQRDDLAVSWYTDALEAGYDSARLYNNLGHSLGNIGRLVEAQKYLDQAVRKNPSLQAARHNRARLELRLAVRDQRVPVRRALDDFELALKLGPHHRELPLDGARLYALCAQERSELRPRARQLLIAAISLGVTRSEVDAIAELRDLASDSAVERAYEIPSSRGDQLPLELTPHPE